jgi:hypothetical protein
MTEAQFFHRTVIAATGLTLLALVADRAIPHAPIAVAPFGEPWLSVLGGVVLWLAILVAGHVGRWAYLIIRGRDPDLG